MKLVLLGTAGYHPTSHRHTACLMMPAQGILLDAGTAVYRVPRHLATDQLDIFLTHAHLDHVVGLTYLIGIMYRRNIRRVTVHGDAEKLAAVEEHLFADLIFPKKPAIEFLPLGDSTELPDGGRLTHFPVPHPGGCLGFRLDWPGHSMAYVTDTTAVAGVEYIEKIRGVDLLVHECDFPDSLSDLAEQTGHSFTTPVATVAKDAAVGRLVLTHFDPDFEPSVDLSDAMGLEHARAIFSNTVLGYDWMEVEF